MCPFCIIPHPLIAGEVSPCGTYIKVSAVQRVYKARHMTGMVCARCGKEGGEMIHARNAFIHLENCTPNEAWISELPKFSRLAEFVFKMKDGKIKTLIENRTGKARSVMNVEPDGKHTGVLGYFFYRSQDAERTEAQS